MLEAQGCGTALERGDAALVRLFFLALPLGGTAAFIEFTLASGPTGGVNRASDHMLLDDVYLAVAALPVPTASVVPEPASSALMLAGLGLLATAARRQRSTG